MKKSVYIFIIIIGILTENNIVMAQTQLEINIQACSELKRVDYELNESYKIVLSQYRTDKMFTSAFIDSQRKWLVFRDAYLKSIYPNTQTNFYGSLNPMCRCNILTDMTNARLKQIKMWIDGIEEGNACQGSMRTRK